MVENKITHILTLMDNPPDPPFPDVRDRSTVAITLLVAMLGLASFQECGCLCTVEPL